MLNPVRPMTIFGIYLALSGIAFVTVPNVVLPVFGFPTTTEVWIRVVGLLVTILGFYFLYSVRHADQRFYRASIIARLIFFTGVTGFALLGLGSPMLIAFGVIDLIGAGWTWFALQRSSTHVAPESH